MCDTQLDGFQEISDSDRDYYGAGYMVGETITKTAGRKIAELFGGEYLQTEDR
jgi:hypothetical protein